MEGSGGAGPGDAAPPLAFETHSPRLPPGRADQAVSLLRPTGHCSQWSRPDLVAALLARIVRAVAER